MYKWERESRVLTLLLSTQQWLIRFNPEIHSMDVINKQETTLLKNKDNLSSIGTDHPPTTKMQHDLSSLGIIYITL